MSQTIINPETLLRLPKVLQRFPVSRSDWYAGVRAGKYPTPVKLSERSVAWRASDIDALIDSLPLAR
ncbi:Prophage CP4-57 regulatory protein (AlpA) [compost metagenome]